MTVSEVLISPTTGLPFVIDTIQPRPLAANPPAPNQAQAFLFQLPLPGQEGFIEMRGRIVRPGTEVAPQAASPTDKIDNLKKKGYKIPKCLEKIIKWFKCAWKGLEKTTNKVTKCLGAPLKYLGLALLIAGTVYIFVVVFTFPPATLVTGGLSALIVALVTKGAIPILVGGGTIFFFGKSLMKGEAPAFHNFATTFPLISWNMNQIPSNYNPNDPHHLA